MTPQELDAIRARDARGWVTQTDLDRRALLAEVDRLTAALADELRGKEEHRLWCINKADKVERIERARIRAGVEGLDEARQHGRDLLSAIDLTDEELEYDRGWNVAIEEVLRVIDGGEA
jgi:hypothetical protein